MKPETKVIGQLDVLADLFGVAYAMDGEKGGEHSTILMRCALELTDLRTIELAKQAGWTRREDYGIDDTDPEETPNTDKRGKSTGLALQHNANEQVNHSAQSPSWRQPDAHE